jgi:hypothetical protein
VIKLGVHTKELKATGTISIHHAAISCQLELSHVEVNATEGYSLRADHVLVDGSLHLTGFKANRPIYLHGANIECALNMSRLIITLEHQESIAVEADAINVKGNFSAQGLKVDGVVALDSAVIGGALRIGGKINGTINGRSLSLDRSILNGIAATGRLECGGGISIADAQVGGSLKLDDVSAGSPGGKALDLGGTRVSGDVSVLRGRLNGVLDAPRLEVHGDVRLADATLVGTPNEQASRGAPADQLRGGRWRGSSVRLTGAKLLGDLDMRGANLNQTLDLSAINVVQIVDLDGATLGASTTPSLILVNAHIGQLRMRLESKPTTMVTLRNSQLDVFEDSTTSWPVDSSINIEGLQYKQLYSDMTTRERNAWLVRATSDFSPQPYEQLALMYETKGDSGSARDIRFSAIKRMYASQNYLRRFWGIVQNVTVGFGYRPSRAFAMVLVLWILGTIWFTYGVGDCLSSGSPVRGLCPVNQTGHPSWNPALLAIDLISPFSSLGNASAWQMSGPSIIVSIILTLGGWVLVTTIAAAVARTLRNR